MTLINTDGMTFLGPGSEWFWTAFQGVVVALSLWGLLRQVRIQTAQKMREDVDAIGQKWESERMLRHRLTIAIAARDGHLADLRGDAPSRVANFWEEAAILVRTKHYDKAMTVQTAGGYLCETWEDLEPYVTHWREVYSTNEIFSDWEWLVHEAKRMSPHYLAVAPPRNPETTVRTLEQAIETEVVLRH